MQQNKINNSKIKALSKWKKRKVKKISAYKYQKTHLTQKINPTQQKKQMNKRNIKLNSVMKKKKIVVDKRKRKNRRKIKIN